ncbi:MAG TPA: class I SAM-dependent methyltransferase [Solirubrobacterales bacterium]|nr:class I SAM-dependent methyltransferase [Solirubrobacterales bacterium]
MTAQATDNSEAGYSTFSRALVASSLPSLAWSRDRATRPIAAAARTTVLGRIPPAEREWLRRIEDRRRELARTSAVTGPEFHAGERPESGLFSVLHGPVSIASAASVVSVSPLWGLFLMRLVRELSPRSCIELGTGFGLSGCYQGAALELNGAGTLTTLEGAPEWAMIAEQGFAELELGRVEVRVGPLGETLQRLLSESPPVDFAFVDAEHGEAATLGYLGALLPHMSDAGVVVFDDISFSREMIRAWRSIRRHPRISFSIGMWRFGIAVVARAGVAASTAT